MALRIVYVAIGSIFLAAILSCGRSSAKDEQVVSATKSRIECPASIETKQQLLKEIAGWQEHQLGSTSRAIYAAVLRGSPVGDDIVIPDDPVSKSDVEQIVWDLPAAAKTDGLWLLCAYQNARVTISKRIPDTATRCVQNNSTDRNLAVRFLGAYCE